MCRTQAAEGPDHHQNEEKERDENTEEGYPHVASINGTRYTTSKNQGKRVEREQRENPSRGPTSSENPIEEGEEEMIQKKSTSNRNAR